MTAAVDSVPKPGEGRVAPPSRTTVASDLVGNELISTRGRDIRGRVSLAFLAVFSDGGAFLSLLPCKSQGRRQQLPPTLSHPSLSPWAQAIIVNLGFIFHLLSFHIAF